MTVVFGFSFDRDTTVISCSCRTRSQFPATPDTKRHANKPGDRVRLLASFLSAGVLEPNGLP
jgi:hypothetical protein